MGLILNFRRANGEDIIQAGASILYSRNELSSPLKWHVVLTWKTVRLIPSPHSKLIFCLGIMWLLMGLFGRHICQVNAATSTIIEQFRGKSLQKISKKRTLQPGNTSKYLMHCRDYKSQRGHRLNSDCNLSSSCSVPNEQRAAKQNPSSSVIPSAIANFVPPLIVRFNTV